MSDRYEWTAGGAQYAVARGPGLAPRVLRDGSVPVPCADDVAEELLSLADKWREAEKRAERERWIPVEERLPEDSRAVLIWAGGDCRIASRQVSFKRDRSWWEHDDGSEVLSAVRFWRELPKGPA